MPIRFRCAYCNQLMGIGRRKAGTIVRCPRCAGEVIVPAAQAVPSAAGPGVNPLFEQDDFAQELAELQPIPEKPGNPPQSQNADSHPPTGQLESNDPEVISEPASGLRRSGLFLPTPIVIVAVGLLLGVLGIVFWLGFALGRSTAP